jgi:DNA-binding IclR family transcriptional regulator
MASAPNGNASEARQQVTALARGLAILQCFTTTRKQLGSAEIARLTGLPQPTVWRLCRTLVQGGFLAVAPGTQRLQLGASVLALGFAASAAFDILEIVRPRMQQLADRYNAACSVAGRDGLEMVYLQRCEAEAMFGMNLQRGSRLPIAKSTLGWAHLVGLPQPTRDALLRELRKADPEQSRSVESDLPNALRDYERKGFLLRRGLTHREIIALAVPIVSTTSSQVLAINCSGNRRDLTARQLEDEIAPQLKELAATIGGALASGSAAAHAAPFEPMRAGARRA